MNRTSILELIAERADALERELFEFLRIPSVSRDPEHAVDMERAAGWLVEKLSSIGMHSVERVETEGPPILLASRQESEDAPTLLVYGHYDVQPPEPLGDWSSEPFEPVVRDGRIYARGATDDKGQLHMHLAAIETLLARDGRLPLNVKLLIEGEEETGSRSLEGFVRERAAALGCDAIVISDSEQLAPDIPAIETGFRGIVFFSLEVTGPDRDLHSGLYGGAVTNPANALARILAGLQDDNGRLTIEGIYDDVREPSDEERAALASLPFNQRAFLAEVGVEEPLGGDRESVLEKIWYRPSLDVHAVRIGEPGDAVKTAVPTKASAVFSVRVVPNQDPSTVAALVRARVEQLAPAGVTARLGVDGMARPWETEPTAPLYRLAAEVLGDVFGNRCRFIHGGGTLPIVSLFEEVLAAPVLLIGFGLPGSNPHGPDEWLDLGVYRKGIAALATLYVRMGAALRGTTHPATGALDAPRASACCGVRV